MKKGFIVFDSTGSIKSRKSIKLVATSSGVDTLYVFADFDNNTEETAFRVNARIEKANGLTNGPYLLTLSQITKEEQEEFGVDYQACRKLVFQKHMLDVPGRLAITIVYDQVNEQGKVFRTAAQARLDEYVYEAVPSLPNEEEINAMREEFIPRDLGDITPTQEFQDNDQLVITQNGTTRKITGEKLKKELIKNFVDNTLIEDSVELKLTEKMQQREDQYEDILVAKEGQYAPRLSNLEQNKADKNYVEQLTQSLASGSPKGVFPTSQYLDDAIPNGDNNIYVCEDDGNWYYFEPVTERWVVGGLYQSTLNAEVVDARYSSIKHKSYVNIKSRLDDLDSETSIIIHNKLENSRIDSVNGWTGTYGTIEINDNKLIYTVSTPHQSARINYTGKIPNFISNNLYYAFINILVSKDTNAKVYLGDNWAPSFDGVTIKSNEDTRISIIHKPQSNSELGFYVNTLNMEVGDKVKFSYAGLIDITNDFGKELSLNEIDKIMHLNENGWIKTSKNMLIDFINDNKNKIKQMSYYIVAANNSIQKNSANFVCNGINDQKLINKAINSLPDFGGTIELLEGTYILNLPIYPKKNTRIVGKGKSTILKVANKVEAKFISNSIKGSVDIRIEKNNGFQVGMDISIFSDVHNGYNGGQSNKIININKSVVDGYVLTLETPLNYDYLVVDNAFIFSAFNAIDCYGITDVTIENLQIDGNKTNQLAGNYDEWQNGVYLVNSHNSVVKDCYIHDCAMVGICGSHYIDGTIDGNEKIQLINNYIENCYYNAIHLHGTKKSLVKGNIVKDGVQSVMFLTRCDDIQVGENIVYGGETSGSPAFLIGGSNRIIIDDTTIRDVNGVGVRVIIASGSIICKGIIISNSSIIGSTRDAIMVAGAENCIVSGCYIANCADNGINLDNCKYSIITGNTIEKPTTDGIKVRGEYNSIVGNVVIKENNGIAINSSANYTVVSSNVINSISTEKITVTGTSSISVNNVTN